VTASPGGQWTLVNASFTSATVSGLTGGVNYTFTVHAVSLNGESPDSAPSSPIMAIGPPGAPTSPSSVPGNASAVVRWSPPTNPGSSPVTGYILTPYLGATAQPTHTYDASTTSATLTGLPNGAIFSFTIVAVNDQGSGPPSDGSPTVTVIGIPTKPSPNPVAVSGNERATLSWKAPVDNGSPITSYLVIPYRQGTEETERTFNGSATTVVITGLVNEQTYTFTVAAINAAGRGFTSDASNPVKIGTPTAPPAPNAVPGTATATTGSLIVSHGASTANGAAITKYTATCTSSNGGVARSAARTGTTLALPITVTGLTTKKTYTCVVRATNVHGVGAASTATAPIIVGTPAAPTAVTATRVAAGQLRVAFTPGANNGAAITSFTATCVSSNGGMSRMKVGLASPLTVIALTVGKTYTCRVKATNSRGTGPASAASPPKTA